MTTQEISQIRKRLDAYMRDKRAQDKDADAKHGSDDARPVFLGILRSACTLIRDIERQGNTPSDELIAQVDDILNDAVDWAYGDGDCYDFMPSFAHDAEAPLVKDKGEGTGIFAHSMKKGIELMMAMMSRSTGKKQDVLSRPAGVSEEDWPGFARPWAPEMKPHPNSTPLARFRQNLPTLSATAETLTALHVYQARCEIATEDLFSPVGLRLSTSGSFLAYMGCGGWKNRDPALSVFRLEEPARERSSFPKSISPDVGLASVAYQMAVHDARSLVFVGDDERIKSYDVAHDGLATHTLKSYGFSGALAWLPGDRLVRAGKGKAAIWNIADPNLPTHGEDGETQVGEAFDPSDSWRDNDGDDIEISEGASPHTTVRLEDPQLQALTPATLHPHPARAGTMLAGFAARDDAAHRYYCLALDLEYGGKTAARYLGHGGDASYISTSAADPNAFVTACSDGFVRLFDVRHALPVLTMDNGGLSEMCPAALLIHPDGIPTVVSGCERGQAIKVWDVRARAAVYELSTGNNAVVDLAWDEGRTTLYAATECSYMDRLGNHHEYRPAKVPKLQRDAERQEWRKSMGAAYEPDEDEDEDMDDDEDDEDDDEERCWPVSAYHAEDHFGFMFDSGDHRLFRYAFKENADPKVLPPYGDARTEGDQDMW